MKMIFHYPGPFYEQLDSGEKKRPKKLRNAFENIGCEVIEFVGPRKTREKNLEYIVKNLNQLDFVYSENSTLPLALTEPSHIPKWPCVDYRFFRAVHQRKIPIGVFYRDLYWQFPSFSKSVHWLKALFAIPFYKNELKLYAKTAKVVFVPSIEFAKILPIIPPKKIVELPPGGDPIHCLPERNRDEIGLVYVGSVAPPIYDISEMLAEFTRLKNLPIKCTIYARKDDWDKHKFYYSVPENVNISHCSGSQLEKKTGASSCQPLIFCDRLL